MWLPTSMQAQTGEFDEELGEGIRLRAGGGEALDPPAPNELDTWQWRQYLLSWSLAGKLGFAVGGVKGDFQSRFLVAEWSRSKTVESGKSRARFGVAARLVVHIRSVSAEANLTLPIVAAEAQLNNAETHANMTVEGYVAADTGSLFPAFSAFDVESYVKLMESMTAAKDRIGSNEEMIKPAPLWTWGDATEPEGESANVASIATTWALTRIKKGKVLSETQNDFARRDEPTATTAIERAYASAGIEGDAVPSDQERQRAAELLGKYELHVPHGSDVGG
jgi:hypothetical protein